MEGLLTPVSKFYKNSIAASEELLSEVPKVSETLPQSSGRLSTPEEALEVLRAEPGLDTLRNALQYLAHDSLTSDFKITSPSPISAQIINVLVLEIVPNFWAILSETSNSIGRKTLRYSKEKKLLLSCLRSVSGLNAILIRIKALLQQAKEANKGGVKNLVEPLKVQLDVLEALLHGDQLVLHLWNNVQSLTPAARQRALWQEVTILLGGGKLLNGVAEATSFIQDASLQVEESKWIADGMMYSRWLTRNVIHWSKAFASLSDGRWNPFPELLSKCLRLGYPDAALDEVIQLLLRTDVDRRLFDAILNSLPISDQRLVWNATLKTISARSLTDVVASDDSAWWEADASLVSAAAGYLNLVVEGNETRKSQLMDWLTGVSGAGTGESIGIRRAAVAVLSRSKYDMATVLEKSLQQFGDRLYIRHAPSLQQEVHTQVLLLSAGYVQRLAPLKISMIHSSSLYLNAVSNRLGSTSPRARFLGMLVGEALSELAEKPEKQMSFKVEELESTEAKWYKSLTKVNDSIGKLDPLKAGSLSHVQKKAGGKSSKTSPVSTAPERQLKIISIEEVDEDDENEDEDPSLHAQRDDDDDDDEDDLPQYEKPDLDKEDSDEDPTLIQRDKPTAPVYIRDLIIYLRDRESYDRTKLALSSGPSLIRRKANFGTEVSEHVEELATLLVGLQDKYDIENFQDMRMQGMIAVLTSQPAKMAKWFSKTFFQGDYSVSQRASILTVLSMSARELGGYKEQDKTLTTIKSLPENAFPSKLLPPRLHKIYASEQQLRLDPVDALSKQLSDTMIQPLAASLADKASGPDILKVRTFSSRLAVESRRKPPTTNTLSAIVADSFIFPLTGYFFTHFKAYGVKNIIFEPFLLTQFLKTLGLILHASGTSTLQLPQMTSELWDLLLGLRMQGQSDKSVGEAMIFSFLTLLEMNGDHRRLAEGHGRELVETQRWVEGFFERVGQGSEEDEKVRALAAAVLFRIREVVERYQALLVGNVGGL